MFVAISFATAVWLPAALLVALLAIPVAGIYRMAALLHRGQPASFWDFVSGMRRYGFAALAIGLVAELLAIAFTSNVFFGLDSGGILGWTISALALYGDIGLVMFLVAAWPIIVDPLRAEVPLRSRLKLAALVNVARPGRMFALTVLLVLILAVSAVLFVALLTISVALVSLIATRYLLPAADRLEGRRSKVVDL